MIASQQTSRCRGVGITSGQILFSNAFVATEYSRCWRDKVVGFGVVEVALSA